MSNALAIGATTAVLQQILQQRFNTSNLPVVIGSVSVSARPPDRVPTGALEANTLNIFLYQVTPNPGWRDVELPSLGSNGQSRLANPPLALDLHYMLSAYGSQDLYAEIILGYGLQVLHEMPVLSRNAIKAVFSGATGVMGLLGNSGLDQQEELVKLTPQLLTTEELSKLWTGFQDKYRATAAYLATVVLIRSDQVLSSGPPVRKALLTVMPLPNPSITSVDPQILPLSAGASIALLGQGLRFLGAKVRFDDLPLVDPLPGSTPERLVVTLPGAGLLPGPNWVHIAQRIDMGEPPLPHPGVSSNSAVFMVQPTIAKKAGTDDITVLAGTVTVRISPPLARGQQAVLLLNQIGAVPGSSYSFKAESRESDPNPTSDTVRFAVAVTGGTYLLRVRIDGAETVLRTDAGGTYNAPTVTFP